MGARLSRPTIPAARLVCTAWAAGIALGVTHLRPRLTGASGTHRLMLRWQVLSMVTSQSVYNRALCDTNQIRNMSLLVGTEPIAYCVQGSRGTT